MQVRKPAYVLINRSSLSGFLPDKCRHGQKLSFLTSLTMYLVITRNTFALVALDVPASQTRLSPRANTQRIAQSLNKLRWAK